MKRKGGQSKADFVRGLPHSTPAAEVVKKAAAAGMKMSTGYVYVVRSKSSAKAKAGPGRPRGGASNGAGIERQFVNLALDMGFARAQALLDSARARARQAIG
jgi:hypothetical protein